MASNSIALKHWSRIISRWPVDKVRPESVSFQTLMRKRLEKYQNPAKAAEAAKVKGNEYNIRAADLTWDEAKEMKQANALYALFENRFAKDAPFPKKLRFPESQPTHYDDIITESERAPSRGFLTKMTDKLKGMIRLR
ncbi:hypothetical protein LTR70_000976 [Exophiala xenobiotica]|uniref:Mitochondrial protein M19 n=1 Tax=Lithohypha guttulata TaxID=1690604 RepID=A0ABR0K239_9EURO|nr:hypothetical protein LTR24_008264 [Lithohypha guttulata]KAK5329139.1 hypothetical protein LTR70_000976 [Exophiala xenobiotica]